MNQEWQPIETAPKDEARFLGYDGERVSVVRYGENYWGEDTWYEEDGCQFFATHWMPLPQPPTK